MIRNIMKIVVLLAVALLSAFALVFALAQTEKGKNALARLAAAALSEGQTRDVHLGRLSGVIPFNFQLQNLSISDERGPWLEVEGIHVRWSPFALLAGRLSIHEVTARSVDLLRMPQDGDEAHAETPDPTDWPGTLLRVRVGQLAVKRILLGQDLVDEPAVFALEVKVGETSTDGEKETLVRLDQLDPLEGEGASLRIHGLYRAREGVFTVDARFEEAWGGLVARYLGIEGPLALSFQGHGPARDLEATLRAQAGGIGSIESQVHLKVEQELQILGKGTVRLDPALSLEPIPQMDQELPFSLSIRIPEKGIFVLDQLALESDALSLDLEAAFHAKKQEAKGRYKILLSDMAPLQPILKADLKGRMRAEGHFSGPLSRPQSYVRIEMENAGLNGVKASRLEADFRLELLEDLGSVLPRSRLTGSGALEGLVVAGFQKVTEKSIQWELSAQGPEEERISISRFVLISGQDSLQLSGLIHPSGPKGELEIALESGGLGDLFQRVGLDVPWIGPTLLHATVEGNVKALSGKMQLRAKSTLREEHLPEFLQLQQKNLTYGANLLMDHGKILTISRIWLEGAGLSMEGQGSFDLDREILRLSWDSLFHGASSPLSIPHVHLKGPLQCRGTLEGPVSSPVISARFEARDLHVSGVSLDKASILLNAAYKPFVSQGDIFLELSQGEKWIKAGSDFLLEGGLLRLSKASIEGFESSLVGSAAIDLQGLEVQGDVRGNVSDLSLLLALLGQDVGGSAKGEATFRLGGKPRSSLALSLEASSLSSPLGTAQSLFLESRLDGSMEHLEGSLRLAIRDARVADLNLASLLFDAQGGSERATFQLELTGHYGEDFDARTSGAFALSQEVQSLTLDRFQGHYGRPSELLSFALVKPTAVVREKGLLRMEEASLRLGTGSLTASGSYGWNRAGIEIRFQDLPLELLKLAGAPGLRGKASGSFALEGQPEQPQAHFELLAVHLGYGELDFPVLEPPSIALKGSYGDQKLKADASLRGLTPDPFHARGEIPLSFSLVPFLFSMDPQAWMELTLQGQAPMPHLASLLRLDDQELRGRVETDLYVTGPVENPRMTGSLRLADGGYEHFRSGTILREATLLVTTENGKLLIQEAGANDGGRGSVAIQGWFDLSPEKDFPFQLNIALRDATLLRHDSFTATTGGDLVLAGNRKGALLSGEILVDPLEARIPGRLPPEVAELEIIEIHGEEHETPAPLETQKPTGDPFLEVRLTIVIPARAHLTGRGLESEWRGKIEIQGPARELVITGDLSVVRGHFNFLGKRFNISRGAVSFPGGTPLSPILHLTAEAATREMKAFLELSGKMDSPELTLTSQPPMPSDEILSRLLFGRSVTQITPLQALQLAYALDVLAGRRGFDLMDHTRRMLGLDLLEIKDLGVELDEAALRLGKYLSESVYLEVEQGLGPDSGRASLHWEVTPNITIQTEVGINAEAGAGILWKWDY